MLKFEADLVPGFCNFHMQRQITIYCVVQFRIIQQKFIFHLSGIMFCGLLIYLSLTKNKVGGDVILATVRSRATSLLDSFVKSLLGNSIYGPIIL